MVLVKVYAAFYPVSGECPGLDSLPDVISDEPWLFYEGDMVRISYEGIYFPVEDSLEVLSAWLPLRAEGKMDVIDVENWFLTRYIWKDGVFSSSGRNLNQVLEYSGH